MGDYCFCSNSIVLLDGVLMRGPGIPVLLAISMFIGVAMADEDTDYATLIAETNAIAEAINTRAAPFFDESLSDYKRCQIGGETIYLVKEYGKKFFLYREMYPNSKNDVEKHLSSADKELTLIERIVRSKCEEI